MIELSELRDAAQKAFPADRLIAPRDASWELIAEMGWLMLELPEDQGGLGLGREAVATIHFEMGKVLPAAPLAPALLGLQGIAGSQALADREEWVERICGGAYVPLNLLPARLERRADGSFEGKVGGVFEADMAEHVLVGTAELYALIPSDAPGVTLTERPLWDESRRLFELELDGHTIDPALVVAEGAAAKALHDRLAISAQQALAADCLGGATALLDLTLDYLKTRVQFDRPLAMFQALKHRVADLKVQLTAAEALFWSNVGDEAGSPLASGAMKAHVASMFRDVAEESIQLHGGIGLTQEHPCHLFFKRAFLNCQLCGSAEFWEERAGQAMLAEPS